MRLETIPILVGVLFGVAGLALVADAAIADGTFVPSERRRRPRARRSLRGEAALGAGIILVGVALIGGDAWRYSTLAMLFAFALCSAGVALNWRYVREMVLPTMHPVGAEDASLPAADMPTPPSRAAGRDESPADVPGRAPSASGPSVSAGEQRLHVR